MINQPNTPDHTTTTLNQIVVDKSTLLTKLKENRQKHKEIYDAACAGYWAQVQATLDERKTQFSSALAETQRSFEREYADFGMAVEKKNAQELDGFDSRSYILSNHGFNPSWVPSYPVQHLDDYDRAIFMLELSVADKVSLSVNEFDAYARNNWKWKDEFNSLNLGFVKAITGSMFGIGTANPASAIYCSGGSVLNSSVYRYASSDGKDY